jgi:hypothetical protein
MWLCVGLVLTEVSEERIASIFRVAKFASEALALVIKSFTAIHKQRNIAFTPWLEHMVRGKAVSI